ncbi:O-methyltransferase [Desulfosarcina ovata subsp. sediminis]|uniref:O-methyltransferase n=1 Tax=Desulfosarcina ovata subsp. sediminis TaxID=885957 RepID=A0A5K7ZN02_9BACT|nr:class I SAM-dependent methyltransferase [Desulfosarcina ovata]BBO81825.1 O-methyltransferase [Desulfosarcina ovata subsp. sediminis]
MKLPEVHESPEMLYRMCFASIRSKLLIAAIELKVFDHLSEPRTVEQVAESIQGHTENTMLLLNGLAACDLVSKKNGLYRNLPIAQTFLVEGSPTSLGEGLLQQAVMSERMLANLPQMVLNGSPGSVENEAGDSEAQWAQNAIWMANHERSGVAQQMAQLVAEIPEFPAFRKMLDLGGGPGIFGIAMVKRHPSMQGVVFDRGPVVAVAERVIREYTLERRMTVLAGDYNTDAIGYGYDLIWASSTLNFAQHNLDAVMKKIHSALNPGGVFINLSEGLTDEGTKPDFYVLCTLGWTMNNPMKAFDQGEIAEAMLAAGFNTVRSRTLNVGWGQMDLDIARKA